MPSSRLNRVEEKKMRKRFVLIVIGIILILLATILLGVPLLINLSALLGNRGTTTTSNTSDDKTAPFPPTFAPLGDATNSAQLKLEGFAEAESTLIVTLNGEEVKEIIVPTDGSFSITDLKLANGDNAITATVKDAAGNQSPDSQTVRIMFKKNAPKLELTNPEEGKTFGRREQEIEVKGTTDGGNTVYINDRFVSVSDDGSFTYMIKLSDGENTLHVTAQDPAGNQTKLERKVTYSP